MVLCFRNVPLFSTVDEKKGREITIFSAYLEQASTRPSLVQKKFFEEEQFQHESECTLKLQKLNAYVPHFPPIIGTFDDMKSILTPWLGIPLSELKESVPDNEWDGLYFQIFFSFLAMGDIANLGDVDRHPDNMVVEDFQPHSWIDFRYLLKVNQTESLTIEFRSRYHVSMIDFGLSYPIRPRSSRSVSSTDGSNKRQRTFDISSVIFGRLISNLRGYPKSGLFPKENLAGLSALLDSKLWSSDRLKITNTLRAETLAFYQRGASISNFPVIRTRLWMEPAVVAALPVELKRPSGRPRKHVPVVDPSPIFDILRYPYDTPNVVVGYRNGCMAVIAAVDIEETDFAITAYDGYYSSKEVPGKSVLIGESYLVALARPYPFMGLGGLIRSEPEGYNCYARIVENVLYIFSARSIKTGEELIAQGKIID